MLEKAWSFTSLIHSIPKPLSIPYNELVFVKHNVWVYVILFGVFFKSNLRLKEFALLFIVVLVLITTSFLNYIPDIQEVYGIVWINSTSLCCFSIMFFLNFWCASVSSMLTNVALFAYINYVLTIFSPFQLYLSPNSLIEFHSLVTCVRMEATCFAPAFCSFSHHSSLPLPSAQSVNSFSSGCDQVFVKKKIKLFKEKKDLFCL